MIKLFEEFQLGDTSFRAGGKGTMLTRLYQEGFPVPNGMLLLPAAFDGDRLKTELVPQLERTLAQLTEKRSPKAKSRFAVRSSALAEDSAYSSFAGEFDTVLNVSPGTEMLQAIETVRRSRSRRRVDVYRKARGVRDEQRMAVVIQEMVPATYSGVLFTADPVTGSHESMVGNVIEGLGDELVGGEATGQPFQLMRPAGKYRGPSILRRFGRRMFRLADRLESLLGHPVDIEFAIAGGRIQLLQARPITTLQGQNLFKGEWNDSLRGDYLWVNTNFGEALPDVMTPFTWSIFQIYFQEAFPFELPGNHPMAGNIGGRFYFNVTLLASFLAALKRDPRKMLQEDETIGRIPEEIEIPLLPISFFRALGTILPVLIKARRRVLRNRREIRGYLADGAKETADAFEAITDAGSSQELAELWRSTLEPSLRRASRMLQASMSRLQDSSGKLRRDLSRLVGPQDAGNLLTSVGELDSLGPSIGLARLSRGELSREEYVERYGHRGPQEAELSVPRPAEDPTWIDNQLKQISSLTGNGASDVEAILSRQQKKRSAAWERLVSRHPSKAKSMQRRLDEVADATRVREQVRSEATRTLWAIRSYALRAAEFANLGQDVFYLSEGEILELLGGEASALDLIPARRATYQRQSALPPYPSVIRGRFDPFVWAKDPLRRTDTFDAQAVPMGSSRRSNKNSISGFPGATGIVEGRVRLLRDPDDGAELLPGEILVTNSTNIGWTPLFPRAGAIVTNIGAPLSHAAIVAREFGVPAVVGCGDATMRLKTGDWVRVDGGQGTVELISESGEIFPKG
jgi:pyruvate,water dikinase